MKRITLLILVLLVGISLSFASGKKEASKDMGMEMKMESSMSKVMYSDLDSAAKYAEKGKAVLFFNADWCPACQGALKDLTENGDKLDKNITVVVVNYDKSSDIKTKYGVTSQHTFVQINNKAEKVKIWSGGGVEEINKQLKSM